MEPAYSVERAYPVSMEKLWHAWTNGAALEQWYHGVDHRCVPGSVTGDAAAAALGGVIKQAGYAYPGVRQDQEERVAAKQAADAFASDPTIYNSVLALKLDQAERVKRQLGV